MTLALVLPLMLAPLARAEGWFADDVNPLPLEGDVTLPMPCGGSMVFRKVVTNQVTDDTDALYADRAVWMGWSGARDTAFLEGEWKGYVSGGLINETERYYLIGKYEVTQGQLRSLADCGEDGVWNEDIEDGLAAHGLNWFNAVAFADAYTVWLHQNAADSLPATIGGAAYARLPTEAEWEFATRGGLAVSDTERRNEHFPMEGDVEDYAWYNGTASADGEVQYIGSVMGESHNPLGLFDVYGNVAEIVVDPFNVNKAGRLHGQAGAMTVKGGSIFTYPQDFHSGMRAEVALYSEQIDTVRVQSDDVGMRLVISGNATGDFSFSNALSDAWAQLSEIGDAGTEDPLATLRQLADQSGDLTMRSALNSVTSEISSEIRRREELQKDNLRSLILSGAMATHRLRGVYQNITSIDRNEELYRQISEMRENSDDLNLSEEARQELEEELAGSVSLREESEMRREGLLDEFGIFTEVFADIFMAVTNREDYPLDTFLATAREQIAATREQGRDNLATSMSFFGVRVRDFDPAAGWDRTEPVLKMLQQSFEFDDKPEWFDEAVRR